jgi:integrase
MKNVQVKSNGRVYIRRKVNGKDQYVRVKYGVEHPLFSAEVERLRSDRARRSGPIQGSIAALIADFKASSAFNSIRSATTKSNYRRYCDLLTIEDGHRSVKGIKPAYVRKMRDRYQDKPGKANNWLSIFKTLMDYAAENDWRDDNPASRIKPLPLGEHEPWPADVLEKALANASEMTRLAIIVGLCTGARIGDAIRLQHQWHDGETLEYRAEKTRKWVSVPVHPLLLDEIAKVPKRALTILYDRSGQPFSSTGTLQARLRDLMAQIGESYKFHGLRKNAACYLAEMGLSDTEIGAMLGMTSETVRHYTKEKRAYMIARGAAEKVRRGDVLQLKVGQRKKAR